MASINRSLRSSQIRSQIQDLSKGDDKFRCLWQQLEGDTEIFIIGGYIRDLIYNKNRKDLDVIIKSDSSFIQDLLSYSELKYTKNSFNGYKIDFNQISLDIWSLDDHFYYKNNYFSNENDIEKSCFFNIDSVIYDYKVDRMKSNLFEEAINRRLLDFAIYDNNYIDNNPNKEYNIFRIVHHCFKYELGISAQINQYVKKYCEEEPNYLDNIYSSQFKHNKQSRLSKEMLNSFLKVFG